MLEINLEKLIKSYDQNLLDNLRGFGKENEFLKFWVPGTDDYQSLINLIDALVEIKNFDVKIVIDKKKQEKKIIEKIENFLVKISKFNKTIDNEFINFIVKIDKVKYENCQIKKNTQNRATNELELDRTKHVANFQAQETIKPLYKKNLELFEPKSFLANENLNKEGVFVEKIEDIKLTFVIKNKIIEKLYHNSNKKSELEKLINLIFEIIIKKNIQEAADHGVIYLEEKIRLINNKIKNKGIILPSQAGSYFNLINKAIRNIFHKYKFENNLDFEINKSYFEITDSWKNLTNEEKLKRINSILDDISHSSNMLTSESIKVNKIEHNFKIYLNVDRHFKELQEKKNILLDIEVKLKKLDNTLEVFVDEILDQNKLRLKNSPQKNYN